ncbi:MAG: glycosyltransferase family 4 protein [Cyanobacteria bacterium K_Offshore_surface_m2_239]|nr:glycosyltransferase family 4 protein [Cyanobacteria bacterium K_Offshore_surface_m2_239]
MSTPWALFNGSYLGAKPTGIGVVARDLVAALDPERVPLLDPLGGGRPGSLPIPATLSPAHGRRGHLARLLWTQNQLPRLLKATGAPLLLSPLPEAPLLRGVRSVVLAHDLLPLRHPQPGPLLAYHLAYVPLVLHRAVRVLCNSEATAREVRQRLGVPTRRLVPIRLGFDPGRLRPLGRQREPFFLALGRHDPHKNLARLLRAFAALRDPDGEIRLRLVGPPDDRATPRLQTLARELGIAVRCDWIPWVSDDERLELLNCCRALVMVSLWEGFGLPALEAMACATPVIAARAGALPEVVGDAALLVDPRDPTAIAAAMARLEREPGLAAALGQAGLERSQAFRWERTADEVTAVLRELL